jgi:hypothetical protein
MIWQDLMLDRWVDADVLRRAVASAFGAPVDAVVVADTAEQINAVSPAIRIVLERVRQHRDFPLQLLIAVRDDSLAEQHDGFEGALQVARSLAALLQASVLFAEGPVAPSEWVRIGPMGQTDVVSLDVDETADVDSFFVVSSRVFSDSHEVPVPKSARLTA